MGDILVLDTAHRKLGDLTTLLWHAYLTARDKAEKSRDVADGIAAGKAWAAWLDHVRATCA